MTLRLAQADLPRLEHHLANHFGEPSRVDRDLAAGGEQAEVLIVAPSPAFDHFLLLSAGLSALPMALPAGSRGRYEKEHVELCMVLPSTWKVDATSMRDERWSWPITLLRFWSRRPHTERGTWLGAWHTLGNGDPAQPYTPGSSLVGAVLAPAVFLGSHLEGFGLVPGDPPISILQVIFATAEELAHARAHGAKELVRLMTRLTDRASIGLVDPFRPSVVAAAATTVSGRDRIQ